MMPTKHLDDSSKWEVHAPSGEGYFTNIDNPQVVLEEYIGIPASLARQMIRRARAQGPTLVTDGVLLLPPR